MPPRASRSAPHAACHLRDDQLNVGFVPPGVLATMSDCVEGTPVDEPQNYWVSQVQDLLLETEVVEGYLQESVSIVATVFGAQVSASVTFARQGRLVTVASTDVRAARLDEVQYSHLDGPCLAVLRTAVPILMNDLTADDRFDRYRPGALALGARSCFALPLPLREQNRVGSLNLYACESYRFGASERAEAAVFAETVSRALQLTMRLAHQVRTTKQLRAALGCHDQFDQIAGRPASNTAPGAGAERAANPRAETPVVDVAVLVKAAQRVQARRSPGTPEPTPHHN